MASNGTALTGQAPLCLEITQLNVGFQPPPIALRPLLRIMVTRFVAQLVNVQRFDVWCSTGLRPKAGTP